MTHNIKMPLLMGALMGLMMIFMLHSQVTNEGSATASAALVFIGAHLAIGGLVLAITFFGVSRFPQLGEYLRKFHRPSARHIVSMLISAVCTALLVHLFHGAP